MNYTTIAVRDYLSNESLLNKIIGTFACPNNTEIELFLKEKCINFERKHFARTYLVIDENALLVGYFTLAIKAISLSKHMSNRLRKLVSGYSNKPDSAVYLIGQLAKNYSVDTINTLDGNTLITLAFDYIDKANEIVGGRSIMVECKDIKPLTDFYESIGFEQLSNDSNSDLLTYVLSIDKVH